MKEWKVSKEIGKDRSAGMLFLKFCQTHAQKTGVKTV